jgi:type IV secretory pathway VirJ component
MHRVKIILYLYFYKKRFICPDFKIECIKYKGGGCLMKTVLFVLFFMLCSGLASAADETLSFGAFGKINIIRNSPHPAQVVLFVSGDGGWNLGVVDMAHELSQVDALVAGIDITHYLKEMGKEPGKCSYPASDFEALSQFIQKKLGFPKYIQPILVGYSSGATLVYAVIAQAPPNTFRGAISLGFCPDLPIQKPFCKGAGLECSPMPNGKGYNSLPAKNLKTPWIAFQGTIDQVCDPKATEGFVKEVNGAEIVILPKVGHGYSVPKNWLPQFKEAFKKLSEIKTAEERISTDELKDLPIIEVPANSGAGSKFAVMITGDGGWAGIDRDVSGVLASKGIPVIGLNSLQYFWKRRTPDECGSDLSRIITHYMSTWNKDEVILIGYSLGADVLPFMASRLTQEQYSHVSLISLLGPGEKAEFEFHVMDWIGSGSGTDSLPIIPELAKLNGKKLLCFAGEEETDSICNNLDIKLGKKIIMTGAHHFNGQYEDIALTILREVQKKHSENIQ